MSTFVKRYPAKGFVPAADETYTAMLAVLALTGMQSAEGEKSAVLLYPGLFDANLPESLAKFAQQVDFDDPKVILVAGLNPEAGQQDSLQHHNLISVFGRKVTILTQGEAGNTLDQANWVARAVAQHGIDEVRLSVPAFHLPRAYLTQLKALIRAGLHRSVWLEPRMLILDPFATRPLIAPWAEDQKTQVELMSGEAGRIKEYSSRGKDDVATLAELTAYINWTREAGWIR